MILLYSVICTFLTVYNLSQFMLILFPNFHLWNVTSYCTLVLYQQNLLSPKRSAFTWMQVIIFYFSVRTCYVFLSYSSLEDVKFIFHN